MAFTCSNIRRGRPGTKFKVHMFGPPPPLNFGDSLFAHALNVPGSHCKYLRGGSHVFMCLYDLQKAFHSVEYPVLLKKPFDAGVHGKLWRLLKNWYEGGSCRVKLDDRLSGRFFVESGVKQGSVLSPALFLLDMDPLLRQLQASGVGLSVNNFDGGGFLHADDIRTLATSEASLRYQIDLVKAFAEQNLLKLNVSKCEIVVFSKQPSKALPVRWMVRSCQLVILGSIWVTGGKVIFQYQGHWRKTSGRHVVLSFISAALESSKVISALCLLKR